MSNRRVLYRRPATKQPHPLATADDLGHKPDPYIAGTVFDHLVGHGIPLADYLNDPDKYEVPSRWRCDEGCRGHINMTAEEWKAHRRFVHGR